MAAAWGHLACFDSQMLHVLTVHEVLHTESDDHALALERDAQHLDKPPFLDLFLDSFNGFYCETIHYNDDFVYCFVHVVL